MKKYLKVLTVRQPWVWAMFAPELIATKAGQKNIENRDWIKSLLGAQYQTLAIHSSKRVALPEFEQARQLIQEICGVLPPAYNDLPHGCIVGTVQTRTWLSASPSPWFFGLYGLQLHSPQTFDKPIPARGQLGLWSCEVSL